MQDAIDTAPQIGDAGQSTAGPTLPEYFAVARRRWWLVLACALLAMGAMWLMASRRPDQYTARVLLQKKVDASPLETMNAEAGGPPPADMFSQIDIVRSRSVVAAAVDSVRLQVALSPPARRNMLFAAVQLGPATPAGRYRLGRQGPELVLESADGSPLASARPGAWLAGPGFRLLVARVPGDGKPLELVVRTREDAVAALRGALVVEQPAETNLLRVAYTDPDPGQAAAVANAVAAAYQAQSDTRARAAATRKREFLAGQLAAQADSLLVAQRATADYQQQARLLDPKSEGTTLATGLFQAEGDARTLRFQESVLRGVLASLQGSTSDDQGLRRMVALSDELVPNGADLYRRLQDLQAERAGLTASRYGYTSRGPRVEVVDSQIRETRSEMRAVVQQSLGILGQRRKDAEARVAELRTQVGELPARATTFDRLTQNTDNLQKTFDLLAGKYYEAQVAEATASGDVALLDPATIPSYPDPSHRRRHLVLALLMGLLAGFGGALVLERLDTTIRHRGEAERVTGLKVLGLVPKLSEIKPDGPARKGKASYPSSELDPFRALRTQLRFARAEPPKVFAVTSPGPGEGKSFTALQLARALAQGGAHVLLVDADLRRPTLHEREGVPRVPGLTDVLVGEATVKDSVRRSEAGVYMLAAGTQAPSPADLLDGPAFQKLLGLCRERFDVLVLDTAPVLAVPETAVVCRASEGTLLVIQPYQTRLPALAEAVRVLRQVSAPLLGLVLNKVPSGSGRYGGYYYSYHHYGEYYHEENGRQRTTSKPEGAGAQVQITRKG